MTTPAPSQGRQNYYSDCEASINSHIHLVSYASTMYQSMAFYFDHDDMSLRYLYFYFLQLSSEKKEQADRLMELQTMRGGRVRLPNIKKPERDSWQSNLKVLEYALHLEKSLKQHLLELYQLATVLKEVHLCDFLKHYHLHQQNKTIQELGEHLSNLRLGRVPRDGMAEYFFNNLTLRERREYNPH